MNERFEDIINDLPYSIRHEGNVEALIDYAKEQAERVEELERELERIKVKYRVTKESHYNCSKSTSELEQQNERYREALRFYASLKNWRKTHTERVNNSPSKVIADTGDKAREALEEPE